MLAEDISSSTHHYQLQSGLNEHNRALEYTISFLSLLSDSAWLKEHRISAQQKALDVVSNFIMKPLIIIIGLAIAAIVFYVLRTKLRNAKPQPDTDTTRPSQAALPTTAKQNDKLVLVKGVSYSDIKKVLTGFCNMYNKESYQAQPRLTKLSEREFAITFPYDINFEIYCYFVNYLEYPMELQWTADVTGWTTPKSGEIWITEKSINKKVMLFIPTDDTEHDNVYMTTSDNIGYKLGFAMGEEKQLLDTPKKLFEAQRLDISELADKEFEDFK